MIFLKSHNLVFLKTKKTAGTSIEIALSAYASPQDIVTPFGHKGMMDECMRRDRQFQPPVNWAVNKQIEENYRRRIEFYYGLYKRGLLEHMGPVWSILTVLGMPVTGKSSNALIRNHANPEAVAKYIGPDVFSNAHKVTAVRHPYEQLVSNAYFRLNIELFPRRYLDIKRLGMSALHQKVEVLLAEERPNSVYYFYDGKYAIDTVIRHEHIKEDLQALEKKFNMTLTDKLPFAKGGMRKDRRPAHEVLTKDQMRRCYEQNRPDFEIFGYESYL